MGLSRVVSVVIPTINRPTLRHSVRSCLTAGMAVTVVSDGVDVPDVPELHLPGVRYVRLPRNWGVMDGKIWFGQVATTVGVYLSDTDFVLGLGDDDEVSPDAREVIEAAISRDPTVDVWVPGLVRKGADGRYTTTCMFGDPQTGVGACQACYRAKVYAYLPQSHYKTPATDYHHVRRCIAAGYKVEWLGRGIVRVRPRAGGHRGWGWPESADDKARTLRRVAETDRSKGHVPSPGQIDLACQSDRTGPSNGG
jgi:hypothetical protein